MNGIHRTGFVRDRPNDSFNLPRAPDPDEEGYWYLAVTEPCDEGVVFIVRSPHRPLVWLEEVNRLMDEDELPDFGNSKFITKEEFWHLTSFDVPTLDDQYHHYVRWA